MTTGNPTPPSLRSWGRAPQSARLVFAKPASVKAKADDSLEGRAELSSGDWRGESGPTRAVFVGCLGRDWRQPEPGGLDGPGVPKLADQLVAAVFGRLRGARTANLARGLTPCPLCGATVLASADGRLVSALSDDDCDAAEKQLGGPEGDWQFLNHHELWVDRAGGGHYVAPSLIAHYVRDHGYAPPGEYLDALMALEVAR